MKKDIEKINIQNTDDLRYLVHRFLNGPPFACAFEFADRELFACFLESVGIDEIGFQEKYYYFDIENSIHISESESGYVWISTMGLVAMSRITGNQFINACYGQKVVLTHLLDEAIEISSGDSVYDVDSNLYSQIEALTPTLFHNTIFYFETLAKAYLSVNGKAIPFTHKLSDLLKLVKETMFEKNHNNTLFHANVIPMFEEIVRHIGSIPGKFKEEYVKYDDNPQDTTLIQFNPSNLKNMRENVELSHDMITEMYYSPNDCIYLKGGLYHRLVQKSQNDDQRNHVETTYGFLLAENEDG